MARKFNVDGADWLAERADAAPATEESTAVVLTRMSDGYKYRGSIPAKEIDHAPESMLRTAVRAALAAAT